MRANLAAISGFCRSDPDHLAQRLPPSAAHTSRGGVYGTCPTPGSDDHRVFGMTNVTRAHRTSPRAGLHGGRRKAHNRSAIPGPAIRPALHGEVSEGVSRCLLLGYSTGAKGR